MNNTNNCTPCSNILSPVGIVCESVYAVSLCMQWLCVSVCVCEAFHTHLKMCIVSIATA